MSTNKWTSEAGPRQTKDAQDAISKLRWRGQTYTELSGVIGVSENKFSYQSIFGGTSDAAVAAGNKIAEQYAWTITRENCREIIKAFEAATAALEIAVVDKRVTPEQDAESKRILAEARKKQEEAAELKRSDEQKHVRNLRHTYPWASGSEGLTTHARAAKNMRTELGQAFPGVVFKVKSSTFSGGNSIDVDWTNGPTNEQVDEIVSKYKYGHFDGYDDSYNSDHSAYGSAVGIVLGRVKYVSATRTISEDLQTAVVKAMAERRGIEWRDSIMLMPWHVEKIEGSGEFVDLNRDANEIFKQTVIPLRATLVAVRYDETEHKHVLDFNVPATTAGAAVVDSTNAGGSTCHVEKHHHTKKGFDFWIVVLDSRVERDEFERLRSSCKRAGGWYSRQWGKTPGGFGFEDEAAAVAFATEIGGAAEESNSYVDPLDLAYEDQCAQAVGL